MSLEPLISVLMNCRNEEKLISKSIKSVLDQSYKNIELIVWDDASTDNTISIIKSFDDQRIKLFKNKTHLGLGPSRCKAIDELKGDFIAILDADDEMTNNRIEKQVKEFLKNSNLGLLGSWVKFKDVNGKTIKKSSINKVFNNSKNNKQIKEKMLYKNIFANSSLMYRKDSALNVGWYSNELEYAQDYDLSLKIINLYDCKILKEFLTFITIRKDSMTQSNDLKEIRINEQIKILEKCKLEFKIDEKSAFIISREIAFNKLKLDLLTDLYLITKLFLILKTVWKYPTLIISRLF
jgi:glycosyltransferase involved in cell wall biosynthesis